MTLRFIIPIISLTSALLLSGAVIGTYALLARKEAIVDAEFNLKERLGRVESDFARYDFEQEKFEANRSLLLLTSWPALKWAWLIRKDQEAEELIMDASLSRKDIGRVMLPDNLNHLQCDHLIGFVRKLMDKNIVSGVQVYHCEVDSRMFGGMRISDSYALVGVVDVDSIGGRDNDRESYLLLTVLIGGFVLYFATLYLYLNRKIYSRAVHLLNASFALKQGDLSARSRLKGGDELGMISQSFDAMADRIEQQTLELNQINQSLESKVEDRTKEAASLFQELETNIKQRENILLGLTHEMKTPLTGIMTLTESVMDGSYGELNEGQLKALQLSMDSSQKLYNLINRFLSYANLQMGKISFVHRL